MSLPVPGVAVLRMTEIAVIESEKCCLVESPAQ